MENNSFTLLPMSQRFNLVPGEIYTGKVTIVNPTDASSDFNYKVSVAPYNVVGNDYDIDLTSKYNRSIITDWIEVLEPTGTVAPNNSKDVSFTISVPEDALAGGQYATILVSSNSDQQADAGVAVKNVFEMASIVYANVAGETVHDGKILENNVPSYSAVAPITLTALISNEGNVHEDAVFVITISDFFSGAVILPTEEDEGRYGEIIMPETTRKIERNISNLPAIGIVKISQKIYYNGEVSTVEKDVIICPIWFILLIVLTIASIITAIVVAVKKHKRKNFYL